MKSRKCRYLNKLKGVKVKSKIYEYSSQVQISKKKSTAMKYLYISLRHPEVDLLTHPRQLYNKRP